MPSPAYQRFLSSMTMDFDKWHDGTGYDLAALDELTPTERDSIRTLLQGRTDWRDAEALAHLTPPATADLRATFNDTAAPLTTRLRAGEELERLGEAVDFEPLILAMLDQAVAKQGASDLTRVSDFIEWRHNKPPHTTDRVRRKILQLLSTTHSPAATNLAALACVIYNLTPSTHDWTLRPLWLRFQDERDHAAAFDELLSKIGLTRDQLVPRSSGSSG